MGKTEKDIEQEKNEEKSEKEEDKSYAQTLKTGISLSFASCTRFSVAFFFSKSSLSLPHSQCELKSMCIVLQMMTQKGSKCEEKRKKNSQRLC